MGGSVEGLDIKSDDDRVADDDSAFVKWAIPTDTEVVSVDASGGAEASARDGPLVLVIFPEGRVPAAKILDVQSHRLGDPANRELAAER